MRVGIIGDLHGRDCWKKFVRDPSIDKWMFLGDYCDSFNFSNVEILHNLKQIIQFKLNYPDKVVLLLGNHDLAYRWINDPDVPMCSGYRPEMAYDLHFLFNEHKNLFKVSHQINNHLFTHAGISEKWFNKHKTVIKEFWEMISDKNDRTGVSMSDMLNALVDSRHRAILFEVGELRGGDRGSSGGPFWSDYRETKSSMLDGFNQYVGHSRVEKIHTITKNNNTSITYCDVLDSREIFHIVEI